MNKFRTLKIIREIIVILGGFQTQASVQLPDKNFNKNNKDWFNQEPVFIH